MSAKVGELRHLLEVHAPVAVPDAMGGRPLSFQYLKLVWARVESSGDSNFNQDAQQSGATHTVTIRDDTSIKPGMVLRFRDTGRMLRILDAVRERERPWWGTLNCAEVASWPSL